MMEVTTRPTEDSSRLCSACQLPIQEKYMLHSMEQYWHTDCLRCSFCQQSLGKLAASCFTKSGLILCKKDYIKLFGEKGKCNNCGGTIPADEMVMKAGGIPYHVNCFTCVTCQTQLLPGDKFHVIDGCLICERDSVPLIDSVGAHPEKVTHTGLPR